TDCDIHNDFNLSLFLEVLGQKPHQTALRALFDALATRLGQAVPDLGRHTAGDATALNARPKRNAKAALKECRQGLPQPSGGKKEDTGEEGKGVKEGEWVRYKRHL